MGLRVFLTGLSGYLGETLANHLALAPDVDCVTSISRSAPLRQLPPKVEYVKMDMRSPELAAAIGGHDVIMHTAAIVMWPAGMTEAERNDINLNGIRNVANAAVTARAGKFIQASSVAVYFGVAAGRSDIKEDESINDRATSWYYANAKAHCERTLREIVEPAGISLTLLRPSWIVGPGNRTTRAGFRSGPARFHDRDPRLQFIHEDDVADAFLLAMRTDLRGAYNVVPDDATRWSTTLKEIGVRFAPVIPVWLARVISGLAWRYGGRPSHPSWVDAVRSDVVVSNARLKGAGWQPRYTSLQALKSSG